MPTNTYTPLANITLASTDSEIVFASIPATYRDLVLVCSARGTITTFTNVQMRFNSDTGSNYSTVAMYGTGSAAASYSETATNITLEQIARSSDTASVFTPIMTQVMDYSATDKHKTVLTRNSSTLSGAVAALASRWASTSAITSITLYPYGGSFAIGSTFSLYGVIA
jgi:hypothetical protein